MGWKWKTFDFYHLEMSSSTGNECFWLNSICMQISAFSKWSNRWDLGGWSISCSGLASVASQEVEFLLIIEAWQHASMIFPGDCVCVCVCVCIKLINRDQVRWLLNGTHRLTTGEWVECRKSIILTAAFAATESGFADLLPIVRHKRCQHSKQSSIPSQELPVHILEI